MRGLAMPIACRPTTSLWCVTFCRRIWWRPSFPGGSTVNCTPCWCQSLPALQTGNNPTYGKSPMSSRLASKAARDASEDGSEIDLHDLGPFPEIQDLLSAVTDTELLSEFLAEAMVEAQPEEIQDLVLDRPAHRHPREPPRRGNRSESGAPGAGLGLCVNGQAPGDRTTRNPSASGTPGRARRCLHRIGPRGRSKHLP